MRFLALLLALGFTVPAIAQDKKAEKKAEKKPAAAKKADSTVAPAKAGAQKKAEKKTTKKVEKTTAEPKQDWGRFQSQAKKDEKDLAKAAKK